jgi:hypothetical protein
MKFDLVIERGFLQHLSGKMMDDALRRITELLSSDSIFYSLMAAAGGRGGYWGMKRWKEGEIRDAMRPYFHIITLQKSVFTPGEKGSIPAWAAVMKRNEKKISKRRCRNSSG